MRQSSGANEGKHIQQVFTDAINSRGNLLQITPGPSHPGRHTGVRQLKAIIIAPDPQRLQSMHMEGSYNIKDSAPFVFTFPGGSDVMGGDKTEFQGFVYEFMDGYPQPYDEAELGIQLLGLRTVVSKHGVR